MPDYPEILSDNFLDDATATYDSTEDDVYKVDFMADRNRGSKFKGENTTPQHIVYDLGAAASCDTFVLDKDFVITGGSGRHLRLQHSETDDGSTFDTDAVDLNNAALATTSLPIWKTFTSVSRRYWRLRLEGISAAPEIFNIWLGARIALTMSPYGNFDPWKEESIDTPLSATGGGFQNVHHFSRRLLSAQFENLSDTQMAFIDSWWNEAGQDGKNWWWLWKPDEYAGSAIAKWAPVYFNSAGLVRDFGFYITQRAGIIEGRGVL